MTRAYNSVYRDEYLSFPAFPLGGIGAGMVCLEGTGAISHVSVRNRPEVFHEPRVFSAICLKGVENGARLVEGPVPKRKVFGNPQCGNGLGKSTFGFPRFAEASFTAAFPFGTVDLKDPSLPIEAQVMGWSPFLPGDSESASLPVAALEISFTNTGSEKLDAVYSFHAENFLTARPKEKEVPATAVLATERGFVLHCDGIEEEPWHKGDFAVVLDDPDAKADCRWFRGGWFDSATLLWKNISEGNALESEAFTEGKHSAGGSVYLPFQLEPGARKTVRVLLAWYVPRTNVRTGQDPEEESCGSGCGCNAGEKSKEAKPSHEPWYAGRFEGIEAVVSHWREHYGQLRNGSDEFSKCFQDTDLAPEVVEAVAANLTILKSPTVLRQKDGRFWAWEGCSDGSGCCAGSCTHVWNYAQALPHLFPDLERSLRQTEFNEAQDERGHQSFRAGLPIRPVTHGGHAASDGQLGGIVKLYRDWRVSGDDEWLRGLWPQVKQSLAYCIETWDPDHIGVLVEPHHNTYDIEFWGPDGMCSSFYLAALKAAAAMGTALGEDVGLYEELHAKGKVYLEEKLFNGEYFYQDIRWEDLRAPSPCADDSGHANKGYSAEAAELLQKEGPKYQYGTGCLSDGVLGCWMALTAGMEDEVLDNEKVRSHLVAIHKHNLKKDLSLHANPQRPTYAVGDEGGLLLCSWPRGGALSLPFVYSDEVWTGIEYQVASHLILLGEVEKGLEIVRVCRDRYDGRARNPFNEYECGHWYARAMSSYALLQALSGAVYDARSRVLTLKPRVKGDFRAFLSTEKGFGTVGVRNGEPFCDVRSGEIAIDRIDYEPCK